MQPKVRLEFPEDDQEALALFRAHNINGLFITDLPPGDTAFAELCRQAGATHVAGISTKCLILFDDPEKAGRFATQVNRMEYHGTTPTASGRLFDSPQEFLELVLKSKRLYAAAGIPMTYYFSHQSPLDDMNANAENVNPRQQ